MSKSRASRSRPIGYAASRRALQAHLKEQGLDPKDPRVIKEVYKGIFTRIMRTHDLDYYWLWTWEVWQHYDMTQSQIAAIKQDITLAREALEELGNPFQIAMAGWKIGSADNAAEFDDPKLLPYEAPIMGLWDEAESFEDPQPRAQEMAVHVVRRRLGTGAAPAGHRPHLV